jgi:hypothetical protein
MGNDQQESEIACNVGDNSLCECCQEEYADPGVVTYAGVLVCAECWEEYVELLEISEEC